MSAETKAVLDEAIQAHFLDEMNAHMTDYVLLTTGQSIDDMSPDREYSMHRYLFNVREDMSLYTAVGLSTVLQRYWSDRTTFDDSDQIEEP